MHSGMRNQTTKKKEGIVRTVWQDRSITEASYKNGVPHGLYRYIWGNEVQIKIYKEGQLIAGMHFDSNFKSLRSYGDS